MSPQFRQDARVLILNGGPERLAVPAVNFILRGTTTHFVVYYDAALGANGPILADAVLGSCEPDYARLQALFGNISIGNLPFTVYIEAGMFGASHASCPATGLSCAAFTETDSDLLKFLVAVEASEVFMADQQIGWNCGASPGEALSRVIGAEFYPNELSPRGVNGSFKTGLLWLNSVRPNFVDSSDPTDRNKVSIGCGALFINWLRFQLGFSLNQIVLAGGTTLEQTYQSLTKRTDGFSRFSSLIASHFPVGTTASLANDNPFPLATRIYFQGTDNKLWRLNPDGSGGTNLGGYKTKSTPVVFGTHLYFQGTDDALWQINLDGTGGMHVGGGYKTSASPFVSDHIYFRGTDDKLWRVNLGGSGGVNLGGYKTKSTPHAFGGFVFFQGTDNKLWRINLDGSGGVHLGGNSTSAPPFVTTTHVYFRGTDDRLLRINLDGTGGIHLGGYKTKSTPFVTDNFVCFQGTDDKLWRINLDGSGGTNLGGYKTHSPPVTDGAFIYFQGTDNKFWRLNLDGSHGTHLGGFDTASTPGLEFS
jgi:hypothetical protein